MHIFDSGEKPTVTGGWSPRAVSGGLSDQTRATLLRRGSSSRGCVRTLQFRVVTITRKCFALGRLSTTNTSPHVSLCSFRSSSTYVHTSRSILRAGSPGGIFSAAFIKRFLYPALFELRYHATRPALVSEIVEGVRRGGGSPLRPVIDEATVVEEEVS